MIKTNGYEVNARVLFRIMNGGTTKDTKERGVKDELLSNYEMQISGLPFDVGFGGVTEEEFVELYKSYMSNLNSEDEQSAFLKQCETVKARYEEIKDSPKAFGIVNNENVAGSSNDNDSLSMWPWDPNMKSAYDSKLKNFLNNWKEKKNQLSQSASNKQIKKMSKDFDNAKRELLNNIGSELEHLTFEYDALHAKINKITKTKGVQIYEEEGKRYYIIDSGFTNQFAFADPRPMQFYDESTLSSEDKDTIEKFKASYDRFEAIKVNTYALAEIIGKLNDINFASL